MEVTEPEVTKRKAGEPAGQQAAAQQAAGQQIPASKKLFGLSASSLRGIITTSMVLVLLFLIYLMARPLLYYSNDDYRQQGLNLAVTAINPILPESNFEASRHIDPLVAQLKPPIAISVGMFAIAKVPITLEPMTASTNATNVHQNTERWLRREAWTKTMEETAYLKLASAAPTLQYNWDFVILAIGSTVVALVGLWSFFKPRKSQELTMPSGSAAGASAAVLAPAEEYMIADVRHAIDTSDQLFSRSTLLLVGGVVMAFVGVGVFFLSLFSNETPSTQPISSFIELLSSPRFLMAFRSFAMLVFLEAIAWFLLRQYRSLIEDYKSFYRYYMRRANYLAAIKISSQRGGDSQFAAIVKTLLAEDLTGRLKKDETTETLEGQRLIDANFVETVAISSSGAVPRKAEREVKSKHGGAAG
jgi:hypothetical protein